MSKTRTLANQIESAREEIRQRENRLKELEQKQKTQERNNRTRRLCERGGYLESILPNTVPLSLEQFKTFLNKTLKTDFANKILQSLEAENAAVDIAEPNSGSGAAELVETTGHGVMPATARTTPTQRQAG